MCTSSYACCPATTPRAIGGALEAETHKMLLRFVLGPYIALGLMAVRGQARLKLSGLAHVGSGACGAQARRDFSGAYHARRREAYQLHFAAQRLGP